MGRLFVIGDPHLSFGTDKPMDIFGENWKNVPERLRENWNNVVSEEDVVVVNGDISWGLKTDEAIPDLAFINGLNGKKILMKGNHELWWTSLSKLDALKRLNGFDTLDFMYNDARFHEETNTPICGTRGWKTPLDDDFDENDAKVWRRETMRLQQSINKALAMDGEPVIFLHFPPFNMAKRSEATEMTEIIEKSGIKRCYFGHVHGYGKCNYDESGEFQPIFRKNGVEYYLVSGDYVGFMPILVK